MKRYLLIFILALCTICAFGQDELPSGYIHKNYKGRTYYIHIPDGLRKKAPLVVVLHGYGSSAIDIMHRGFNEAADKYGFAVCYPQGSIDTKHKAGWNVGYPSQRGTEIDDVSHICDLARHVSKKFRLSKRNIFCAGMSNGGDMIYEIAYTNPGTFAAYGSIAGLAFEQGWKRRGKYETPVPFLEIHGTADKTSLWEGDPDGKSKWGSYASVPLAVATWATAARCTYEQTEELPLRPEGHPVTLHRFLGGIPAWERGPAIEVWLYEIHGGGHSWAQSSIDTADEIWRFFSKYLR
ncbi:MAG: esterase [Bacteroidales bacterium]|nr:esterase [Bacteroidales bacterium]